MYESLACHKVYLIKLRRHIRSLCTHNTCIYIICVYTHYLQYCVYIYICTRPCHPPLPPPHGMGPIYWPHMRSYPSPPVVWWDCGTVPLPQKILKRYIHRSFLNSNYSSITSQKLFANKHIKDYHILPHSFHKITSTYHFHYLIHFSKSSVPTISLPHSFSQNHHSQFITPPFIFTKSSQLIMSSSRSFH